jgi:hypothetical protein
MSWLGECCLEIWGEASSQERVPYSGVRNAEAQVRVSFGYGHKVAPTGLLKTIGIHSLSSGGQMCECRWAGTSSPKLLG